MICTAPEMRGIFKRSVSGAMAPAPPLQAGPMTPKISLLALEDIFTISTGPMGGTTGE